MLVIKKTLMALLTTTSITTATAAPVLLDKGTQKENPYYQTDDEIFGVKLWG